jgi:hypothetical protein
MGPKDTSYLSHIEKSSATTITIARVDTFEKVEYYETGA